MQFLTRSSDYLPPSDIESTPKPPKPNRPSATPARIRKKSRSSTALLINSNMGATTPAMATEAPQLPPLPQSPPLEHSQTNSTIVEIYETPRSFSSPHITPQNTRNVVNIQGPNTEVKVQFAVGSTRKLDLLLSGLGEGLDEREKEKLKELVERAGLEGGSGFDLGENQQLIRKLFLDNIVVAMAKLETHSLVLRSANRELCTHDRWNMIHEDLVRYSKAIKIYEHWLTSKIHSTELNSNTFSPNFQTYAQTLALLELASSPSPDPETQALLKKLSHNLMSSHYIWTCSRPLKPREAQKTGLFYRLLMMTLGGATLIVPMLIMVLDPRRETKLVVTCVCTFLIGWGLALWMEGLGIGFKEMVLGTLAYAAVLVIFVGSATPALVS